MKEFKKLCKEILSIWVKVSIEKDNKNKLYYMTFTSFTGKAFRTVSFKEIKNIVNMTEMLEEIKDTV